MVMKMKRFSRVLSAFFAAIMLVSNLCSFAANAEAVDGPETQEITSLLSLATAKYLFGRKTEQDLDP